jgi:hypothetical protein
MIKRQYTLYLENKPGVLARTTRMLAKAGVNIEGISVAESTHTALVQLVVSNAKKAKTALDKAKIAHTSQQVCIIVVPHKTGVLAKLADKLAKAKVNINFIYASAADDQSQCCVIISADDLDKVERVGLDM